LVVGGELVETKNASATEVRGSRIENGEAHSIGPGEVITIPRGTPHWFKRVSAPFTYYVVKSTHQE
jgi:quercetin dioxygenase-like cupin family protein